MLNELNGLKIHIYFHNLLIHNGPILLCFQIRVISQENASKTICLTYVIVNILVYKEWKSSQLLKNIHFLTVYLPTSKKF